MNLMIYILYKYNTRALPRPLKHMHMKIHVYTKHNNKIEKLCRGEVHFLPLDFSRIFTEEISKKKLAN